MGLPGPQVELHVQRQAGTLERFVMTPTPGYEISDERPVVAVAIADQVGATFRPLFGSRV